MCLPFCAGYCRSECFLPGGSACITDFFSFCHVTFRKGLLSLLLSCNYDSVLARRMFPCYDKIIKSRKMSAQ